ncbi:MAG: transporter related [Dactylosporangium sp.]|jgi:branched-chain amino acid transport system ATP-binding protein|nr:transporter related [Dactylosporangium sp.]
MLHIRELSAWYGEAQVLREVDLEVPAGAIVTLVGRNGAGKTTLLRCVMGLHRQQRGRINFGDQAGTKAGDGAGDGAGNNAGDLAGMPPHRRAAAGIGWVPDDRGIYASLTVEENLTMPPVSGSKVGDSKVGGLKVGGSKVGGRNVSGAKSNGPEPWSLSQVYEAFPVLKERRRFPGTKLSGGEQQMLALARVLRMGARLLLCDEPTEGLSPLLVGQIGDILRTVKSHGVTVLLIEQNLRFATTVADRHYLIADGRVVDSLDNSEVKRRQHELLAYLGM